MKLTKKNLLVLVIFIYSCNYFAQAPIFPIDSNSHKECGYSPTFLKSINTPTMQAALKIMQTTAPASAVINCGRFRLTFQDITASVGYGFDDPTSGTALTQCVCDVANYIQSVLQIPTGDGSPIDIVFPQSWNGGNPAPSSSLLAAGASLNSDPLFLAGNSGFYAGNTLDHYTTGIDNYPTQIDGVIQVNFAQLFRVCSQPRNCLTYDFYSVMLHEFTHVLGWGSFVTDNPVLGSAYSTDQYSKYDEKFLYHGDVTTGPLTKIVNNSGPSINTGLPANALTNKQLWVYGNLENDPSNNQNIPGFSNMAYAFGSAPPPNSSSHLGDYQDAFNEMSYKAPGFIQNYVMGPLFWTNHIKDIWTEQELRMLGDMGYQFTSSFLLANAHVPANHHPYTTKVIYDNTWAGSGPTQMAETDLNAADLPSIDNCHTAVFNLATDPTIHDADGDPIRIFPGSLYNIRGCSNGGINHNGLSVTNTPAGDIITYTPRPDFIGRAQFGFHLYDGKEKGEFFVYTIDVTGCNPCGTNLVVNGNFEEGMEIKTITNPLVDNAMLTLYRNMQYTGLISPVYPDGSIFCSRSSLITEEAQGCPQNIGSFSSPSFNPGPNVFPAIPGTRRYYFPGEPNNYFKLCSNVQNCGRYILEFDIYTTHNLNPITIGFTDTPIPTFSTISLLNSVSQNVSPAATWQHITIPINYCSTTSADYLVFQFPTYNISGLYIDNLNLYVDPSPAPVLSSNINPTPQTICSGQSVSMSATVNNPRCNITYNWSPGGQTTASISDAPSTTTTYVLTVSDGCSTTTASSVVNVITPGSISVVTSASPNNPISGNAVTVNAIVTPPGTYSYAWSPNIGNTSSVNFVPTDNAVYTCNVTDQCGNTVSSSLCINLESSLCSSTSNITLNNTNITSNTAYSGQVITVIGTINISNCTVAFNSCTLKMSTNSKIIVDPTSIITMANSKLFSCEGMWFGIEAQSNTASAAKVSIRGTSIEDAYNAIIANNNFVNINNSISLTSVTLNKNYIDVSISNASSATSYPLLIQSCDLTSNLSTTSPGNSLKCSGYYPVGTPAVKARSFAGLFADRAGVVILTNNNIGANFTKVSNKDYGLFLRRTDATVYNIQFRNIQSTAPLLATTPTLPIGVAIFSGNSRYLTVAPISAPVNNALLFNNVGYGIISNKTAALEVTNAVFNNPAQFSTNSLGVVTSIGSSAVYAIDADATLRINLNTISKVYNAITATYSVAPKAAGLFSISQNAITAGSGTLNTAIDILSTLNTPFTGVVGNQIVAANQITNASTAGVRMLNVTGTNGLRVSGNTITLKNIATGTRDGILLNGGNNNVMIDNNNVDGNLPGNNPTSYNLNCSGIRSVNSPGCYLQCNSITHTGKGIVYSGNNSTGTGTGAEFFNNKLNAPIKQGLVLTNGAIIGTQGNSTGASANVWNGFNATNSDQTMVGGPFPFSPVTNAINSILWVHNVTAGSVERPTDNQFQTPAVNGNQYLWNINLLGVTGGNIITCPNALTTGAKVILTPTLDVSQRDVDYSTYITTVVTPTANNATPQAKWMLKQHMHKAIRQTQLGNNATVTNFYAVEQNGDAAKYYEVDSLLTNGDTILAKAKNTMAPLNNDMEQTHHDFNALYLSGITNATDYAALETIANLCADKYGNAVYQARALLNIVTYGNRDFEEDCDKGQGARIGNFEEEDGITVADNVQAKLFPNPNNGSFTLSYDLKQIPEATIKIMDVTGKEVYLLNIDNLNNLVQINSSNLSTGIYFIQLINNQKLLWTDKVVISK